MSFIPFVACKLSAIAQGSQCSTDSTCFSLLNEIGEACSLFRLCPCRDTTLTILDNCPENHKTFRTSGDLLVTTPFGIPDIDFLFSVTIQIQMEHFGFNRTRWKSGTKPDKPPLNGQIISRAMLRFNLHDMFTGIKRTILWTLFGHNFSFVMEIAHLFLLIEGLFYSCSRIIESMPRVVN